MRAPLHPVFVASGSPRGLASPARCRRALGLNLAGLAVVALAGVGLGGCGDGPASAASDGAGSDARRPDGDLDQGRDDRGLPEDRGPGEAGPDAVGPGDAVPDFGSDLGPDLGPDAAVDPAAPCPSPPSVRPAGAWGVHDCRLARGPDPGAPLLSGPPRAVVVGGDVLDRSARSPRHTAAEYASLAAVGVDLVWLLLTWDGMEPLEGAYNGAWFGRTCEQIALADAAGLGVVLAVHQRDLGPAVGGVGVPAWATATGLPPPPPDAGPEHPARRAAWAAFWAEGPDRLLVAWDRLLATCPTATGVVGLMPLAGPLDLSAPGAPAAYARYAAALEARTEAAFGPLVVFHAPETGAHAGPDQAWAAPGLGAPAAGGLPGRAAGEAAGLARLGFGAAAVAPENPEVFQGSALDALTEAGAAAAVFEDGFGTAGGLRDDLGRPTPLLATVFGRPWPVAVAGRLQGFSGDLAGGFEARWVADGRDAGLSRFQLGPAARDGVGAALPVRLEPDGPFTWFSGFDPVTGELTVFVEGAAGPVALRVGPVDAD